MGPQTKAPKAPPNDAEIVVWYETPTMRFRACRADYLKKIAWTMVAVFIMFLVIVWPAALLCGLFKRGHLPRLSTLPPAILVTLALAVLVGLLSAIGSTEVRLYKDHFVVRTGKHPIDRPFAELKFRLTRVEGGLLRIDFQDLDDDPETLLAPPEHAEQISAVINAYLESHPLPPPRVTI
jgi:hypothetical protein